MVATAWCCVLWCVFLVIQATDEGQPTAEGYAGVHLEDFDEVARNYVNSKGQEYGRQVSWWDLYGRHSHLVERPQYHKYKIRVWSDTVQYGQVSKTVEKPGYVYTQWFHNAQSVPLVTEFHRQVELQSSYSWSIINSVKMNTEIKATAGIPDYLGINAFFNSSVDLQDSRQQTKHEKEIYAVKNIITVPPKKSVKAEFVITEKDVEVPWEADVEIEGYIAIWFSEKYDGHWLWFHPITMLADDRFRLSPRGDRLVCRAKGVFRGMRGVDTTLRTYEYDLIENGMPQSRSKLRRVQYYKPELVRIQ